MKKALLVISLIFISFSSQSQILITLLLGDKLNSDGLEFGLEGGGNWATISGLETKTYDNKWNLGFYFDIRIKNQWFFYTGVLVKSNLGADNLSINDLNNIGADVYFDNDSINLVGNYSQKMNYFLVPALIKYKFKNHFYAEIGPQFGLMYKSWVQFDDDIADRDVVIKEYNTDNLNKIDVGAIFGFGYKLMKGTGWTIGIKYYYGFIDVYKNVSNTKNSSLFLKLNIPIGAGENPKKEK